MFKELKENIVIVNEHIGHLRGEIETIKESSENFRIEKLDT